MLPYFFPTITLTFMIIAIPLIHFPSCLHANDDEQYLNCNERFDCASAKDIGYPFWGSNRPDYCGYPGFELDCSGDAPHINITFIKYRVLQIDKESMTLKVARADYWNTTCPPTIVNTTINFSIFSYPSSLGTLVNLTLYYECSSSSSFTLPPQLDQMAIRLNCPINGSTGAINYYSSMIPDLAGACKYNVEVPVVVSAAAAINLTEEALIEAIDGGFMLEWNASNSNCDVCQKSGGLCGFNTSTNVFACHCANGTFPFACGLTATAPDDKGKSRTGSSLVVGLGVGGAGIVGLLLCFWIFFIMKRRKRLANESKSKDLSTPPSTIGVPAASINFSQSTPSYPFLKSDLEKGSTYFGAHIFSYEELEEATDNFDSSRELGDGGFGKVYYGKLRDGRVVAVKRLYENNFKRVEQFKTEVAILTRLRHQNLVTLYGCTSKRSQELLLVYEYIPNGTVADHLHGNRSNSSLLTWPIRLSIAIESAGALAYLHASDVIHRDVKTNNILLDENFRVKVADFGLSRLFPTDVTHISTAPQGTPGYVDPEYYQCYQLTDKSDVFSFGVVLIELISSLPAVDTNRQRHNINLANMAISKIQDHALDELVDPFLGFEKDYTVRRMTTSVAGLAFRCLQQDRDMRPSMDEVLEDLRRIQNEEIGVQKAEVVDISADDVGLLKNFPPPLT
ncbi:LEAF RUST 10 DISEASE-RESISTANCE LOCUS RECEPTOR-LIKE PROTEIN KINASE-like 1.3 [Carya illinoinensis]|uniref:LEAF RUST 10 DISEASE-RESISTANCE LOCUS RECEPTOR-LIKE PROTEIN KINASE-like 1.3 n=1 Tax=Carya illinoinensis TaxID=32201 RepID=UPI001C71A2DB|nr:LEAF RUST 10 DISEASE-RESISTANCE LOCUS RECEPTOR-LIKE PROTEIN KINASE-like 1.3 [Carya illinoinensis]XP_042970198.1 LEAF RUST 10 DISEASE-RESISTANCE LOCUS RECEPTOR-LIKE PROTEIN KINASE-like 1.3 [Carya illinoinensis]